MKKVLTVIIVILFGAVNFAAGFFYPRHQQKQTGQDASVKTIRSGGYKYINPLLDYEQSENTFSELTSFKQKIVNYIAAAKSHQLVSDSSVYFRDLNNGPWYEINASDQFIPASLLKLPLLMAYFKQSETDPTMLTQEIFVPTSTVESVQQVFKPQESLKLGTFYSAEKLLEFMIRNSDNAAAELLINHIPLSALQTIYSQFDIDVPTSLDPVVQISSRKYGSMLRVLFNGSYLTKDDSEKALSILAQSQFKDGLVAGIPANIMVAHKFGEYEDSTVEELHDCGIVYYPNHPYVLCIMTKGSDVEQLAPVIKGISALVYSEIDSQLGN